MKRALILFVAIAVIGFATTQAHADHGRRGRDYGRSHVQHRHSHYRVPSYQNYNYRSSYYSSRYGRYQSPRYYSPSYYGRSRSCSPYRGSGFSLYLGF